jgi:hypothetical protein
MTEEKKTKTIETSKDSKPDVAKTKVRVIPNVPKQERIMLNEGHEPKLEGGKSSK